MRQYIGMIANKNLGDVWELQENGKYEIINRKPGWAHELTQEQIDHDVRSGCLQELKPEQFKVKLKFDQQ